MSSAALPRLLASAMREYQDTLPCDPYSESMQNTVGEFQRAYSAVSAKMVKKEMPLQTGSWQRRYYACLHWATSYKCPSGVRAEWLGLDASRLGEKLGTVCLGGQCQMSGRFGERI